MSPTSTDECELCWDVGGIVNIVTLNDKGRTIEVSFGEDAADFEFFTNDPFSFRPHNAQPNNSSTNAAFDRLQVDDFAKVLSCMFIDEFFDLLLG